MSKAFAAIWIVWVLASTASAADQKPSPSATKEKLVTVVYDVADLLVKPGEHAGYDNLDGIVAVIFRAWGPDIWSITKPGNSTLRELDGTKLEITTTAVRHTEMKELLFALHRLSDIAVVFWTELLEIERGNFDKEIKPRLEQAGRNQALAHSIVIEDRFAEKLRKQS